MPRRSKVSHRTRRVPARPHALLLGLTLALAQSTAAQDEQLNLPSMGDPADQIISPARERQLGEAFMRQVAQRSQIVDDALLADYITGLGTRLVTASEHAGTPFTFFLVKDATVNAFAAPGGFIGVNSGLMLAADTEAQLAGVLAHEVAHVTQRHIARAYAAAQTSSLPTAAAILAAILLGGTSPQASQAALATGIATSAQLQLNYTRANEYEADRLGIQYLARAQFDPNGMVDFFNLLERRNAADGLTPPEYLSTHPLSSNRVAEARNRAQALTASAQREDSTAFQLARARLRVITASDPARLRTAIDRQLVNARGTARDLLNYAAALLAYESSDHHRAKLKLDEIGGGVLDHLFYGVLSAQIAYALGQHQAGNEMFEQLLELYPGNVAILLASAQANETQGENDRAAKALRQALQYSGNHLASTYRTLARVEDKRRRPVESLESLAEYHALAGNTRLAIEQLEQALKRTDEGTSKALRVAARLQQLRDEFAERLRQRGG